ncbi:ATP-grasp domain-containing protein [Actinoplanes sp. N902-109]|uniref:ATP-grasp domain-containing protein n=1 Tax=Actinoplanes sp. (strain N902-109) TaxID=649831 RepID=UPI001E4832A3|nr:ATP-grasp domain-containing protein [Actinoplanes sp. N902-109]
MEKARPAGLDVIYLQKPSQFDAALVPVCAQLLLMDYQDVPAAEALVAAVHRLRPVARIVTQTEAAQLVAGHLSDVLGIPGTSGRTARLLHDKAAMRELLRNDGAGSVPFLRNPSRAQLLAFVDEHGGAVVKPTKGSGSLGVRLIGSPAEAEQAWDWCERFAIGDFLVEKLLTGAEVSVESFSRGGRHTIVAMTAKDTDGGVVETGHVVPAPLDQATLASVAEVTVGLLDAVGLTDGPAHTELILTAEGPRIVESHARRGGDRINDLVALVYGVDLEAATYRLAGTSDPLAGLHPARGAAAIRFLTAEPGTVTGVTGLAEARARAGVVEAAVSVRPGSVVPELRWSEDRCGHVVVHAEDAATAVRLARSVADSIVITTVAGTLPPPQETLADLLRPFDEVLDPFDHPQENSCAR